MVLCPPGDKTMPPPNIPLRRASSRSTVHQATRHQQQQCSEANPWWIYDDYGPMTAERGDNAGVRLHGEPSTKS